MGYVTEHAGDPEVFRKLLDAYGVIQSAELGAMRGGDIIREIAISVPVKGRKPGNTKVKAYDRLPQCWRHLLKAIVRYFGPTLYEAPADPKANTARYGFTIRLEPHSDDDVLEAISTIREAFAARGLRPDEIDALTRPDDGSNRWVGRLVTRA